jgi:hypothetical protein
LSGVTDVLDDVCYLQGKSERSWDMKGLQKGSWSHLRERGGRALSRAVEVGKRKSSFQFAFKLGHKSNFGQILHTAGS